MKQSHRFYFSTLIAITAAVLSVFVVLELLKRIQSSFEFVLANAIIGPGILIAVPTAVFFAAYMIADRLFKRGV